MTIDPGRRTAIVGAINTLNGAGFLTDPVRRDALPGACIAAAAGSLDASTEAQVLKEIDHIIYSGSFVQIGPWTYRGWARSSLLAAIA